MSMPMCLTCGHEIVVVEDCPACDGFRECGNCGGVGMVSVRKCACPGGPSMPDLGNGRIDGAKLAKA